MKPPYVELTTSHEGCATGTAGPCVHGMDGEVMVDLLLVSHCLPLSVCQPSHRNKTPSIGSIPQERRPPCVSPGEREEQNLPQGWADG